MIIKVSIHDHQCVNILLLQLIGKAQLIITLKSREDQLSKEVRSINQQLMQIHSSNSEVSHTHPPNDYAILGLQATPTDTPTDLERRLLTLSAELVRNNTL